MARLKNNARRKLRMALVRVQRVVDFLFRRDLEQQRQRKTKAVNQKK